MLALVLAFRTSWVGILVAVAGVFIVWLIIRAVIDLISWLKDEFIDEFRNRKRKQKRP